jgi:membrane associated rhomboid family serine protease
MLILPVGLEKNEVRRIPWVSASLIVGCVVVQIVLSVGFADRERETSRRLGEAVEYLAQHPYLSGPPRLLSLLGDEGQAALAEARSEWGRSGGQVPPAVAVQQQAELTALVTHAFVHGGWLHLIGNMLFLFLSGPFIEDLYGRPLFAGLYFVAAAAGAGTFVLGNPESTLPLVGASGAIAGVMGAFLWRLAAKRIRFLVLPVPILPAFRFPLTLPAFVVLPLWALQQLYYASTVGEDAEVAFSAHVGGFVVGLVFAVVVALLRVEETVVAPAIEKEISLKQNPDVERASEARLAGDLTTARRVIRPVLQAEPENLDAWIESWEIALEAQDGEEAGRTGLRLMDLLRRLRERDLLWHVAGDGRWRQLPMPSRFLFAVAALYAGSGDGREAIEIYQRVAAQSPPDDVAVLRALVSEGEVLARAGDSRAARQVFERARAHPACSAPWIERMEGALRASQPRPGVPRPRRG